MSYNGLTGITLVSFIDFKRLGRVLIEEGRLLDVIEWLGRLKLINNNSGERVKFYCTSLLMFSELEGSEPIKSLEDLASFLLKGKGILGFFIECFIDYKMGSMLPP